jgi:glycosyltransferase involved in cell wall biosynthesis
MPDSQPIQKHLGVLSLGYTLDLWDDPNEAFGDPRQGIVGYEDRMSYFALIVHSPHKRHLKPIRLADNSWAYPTNSYTAIDSWLRMLLMARRLMKQHRIDLIQVRESMYSGTVGYLLARWLHKPLHVCVYGTNPFERYWLDQSWFNRLVSRWAKPILRSAQGIQVDGSMTARELAEEGIPAERIVVKPLVPGNLADYVAAERDSELRADLSMNGRFNRLVLFVGRIDAQKNVQFLLDVATRLRTTHPHVRFIMIGDGPQRRDLEQTAIARGLAESMLWLGWQSHNQVVKYMATCDIFALPSVFEGFARVLMEAAMAAMPIVTTTVSGSDDAVVSGENGYIVPIGDVDAFSTALLQLVENPEQSREMGLRSRLHVQELVSRYSDPYLQIRIWEGALSRWKMK